MYQFNATQSFSYSQNYLDDYGNLKDDLIYVNFSSSPGCQISGPKIGAPGIGFSGEISEPQYTKFYSPAGSTKEHEIMIDFKNQIIL